MLRQFILFLILLSLAACGFKPVYKSDADLGNNKLEPLTSIEIEPINSIVGAELYQYLLDILPRNNGDAEYILKTEISNISSPTLLRKNSDILRQTLSLTAKYRLVNIKTGQEKISDTFKTSSSYNANLSPYASYIEEQFALENLAKSAAEEIRSRLILYFKLHSK